MPRSCGDDNRAFHQNRFLVQAAINCNKNEVFCFCFCFVLILYVRLCVGVGECVYVCRGQGVCGGVGVGVRVWVCFKSQTYFYV